MIFSIIIPVYNKKELTIFRTLSSIAAQKYDRNKYEIIFIVDGESISKYERVLIEANKMGLPIECYEFKNEGLSSPVLALNFGIKQAKAPFIILNGADIMHLNNTLEKFEKLFVDNDSKGCSFYKEFSNPSEFDKQNHGDQYNDFVFENDLMCEDNLYVATVWKIRRENKFNSLFVDENNSWLKKIKEETFLDYINDKYNLHPTADQLVGNNKRIGYPFLVAAKADLFYEMNGFNENYYRIGWDDFEWWIRSLFFAKTVHVDNIHGLHQYHDKNEELTAEEDLNKNAAFIFLNNYIDNGFIRPTSNINNKWGEYNRIELNSKEVIESNSLLFEDKS